MYIPTALTHPHLLVRQSTTPVQSCSGVSGGGIAGIVLGTFFGTLLLLYFIQTVRGANRSNNIGYVVEERDIKTRRSGGSRSGGGGSRRRKSRGSVREVREVRRPSRVYTSSS